MKRLVPLTTLVLFLTAAASRGSDWANWRGPTENGVATDTNLPEKFSLKADDPSSNLVWRSPYGGRSTPLVMNGHVYLINKFGSEGDSEEERLHIQERVMCCDADTGKLVWEHKFNVWQTDIVAVRLGWTILAGDLETGNIYSSGTQGLLTCFDKDGNVLWEHSLTEEYGRISGYGGRVTSALVDGDLLIISMLNASWGDQAIGRTRFVAFNKKTGAVTWWGASTLAPKDTFYSVPVAAEVGGERIVIGGGGDGAVHAFKVRTGEWVWSYEFSSGAVNCSPVVDGNLIYIGHGEDNIDTGAQGRIICLDGSAVVNGKPKLVWKVDGIRDKFTSPVLHDGLLYVTDDLANLFCLDAGTGHLYWKYTYGKNSKGSPVLADGKMYVAEVNSKFHILQPSKEGCKELHSQFFRKRAGGPDVEINGSAAVANGRVYFMTSTDLFCIGKKDGQAGPITKVAVDESKGDGKPAHLQIQPADIVLYPGDSADLKAFVYDARGRPLGEAEVDWSLAGIRPPVGLPPPPKDAPPQPPPPPLQAKLSAAKGTAAKVTINTVSEKAPPAQFGRVVAKFGDLTGEVRVRVVPKLPYKPNFANIPEKRTPGGWVNTQGKFEMVVLKDDSGERKVLHKTALNPSPLVARANGYIGMPDWTGYTIQADVMGTKVLHDLPDVGIVANRYSLTLWGNTQQLRLTSWDAIPRVDKSIGYPWKEKVWYRMRLTVDVSEGKAVIRGKVWQRDGKEPEGWTVEFTDPVPNKTGAPAIYGNATAIEDGKPGTDIYYENVTITPNKSAAVSRGAK
jgi:outer membrane protein assembly factor BamB